MSNGLASATPQDAARNPGATRATPPSVVDTPDHEHRIRRVDQFARIMDSALRLPGTNIRVGVDSILGLVPGVGDAASLLISAYLIREAHKAGVSRKALLKMVGNLAVDSTLGAVPLAGDIFDVYFKANARNAKLLRRELESMRST